MARRRRGGVARRGGVSGRGDEANLHHDVAPEACRFTRWWAEHDAEAVVQAQSPEVGPNTRRLLMVRYATTGARVRVELARMCIASIQKRQGAMEEIIGLHFIFRCGIFVERHICLPDSVANALLDFLGYECPAMRGIRRERPHRVNCVADFNDLHPILRLRMGFWQLDSGFPVIDSDSDESESSGASINTSTTIISARSTGSLTFARGSVRSCANGSMTRSESTSTPLSG